MKKTNVGGFSKSEAISNSLEGLYAYLTAANIRYKIKHPLFLLFKFSNFLKLFYNPRFELEKKQKTQKSSALAQEESIISEFLSDFASTSQQPQRFPCSRLTNSQKLPMLFSFKIHQS